MEWSNQYDTGCKLILKTAPISEIWPIFHLFTNGFNKICRWLNRNGNGDAGSDVAWKMNNFDQNLFPSKNGIFKPTSRYSASETVWPDWAIYWTLANFLKPLATINLPKSSTFLRIFCKVVKIYHFQVKSFLGNFYRHLVIFFWSHCSECCWWCGIDKKRALKQGWKHTIIIGWKGLALISNKGSTYRCRG